jgi:hypothetical protein
MCAENIKRIHSKIAFVTIPVLLLAATVTISVTVSEDAFAKDGRYSGDTSQAASVSNECLNPIFDSNSIDNAVGVGNCGGTVSQQDESGQASAPITHQDANPTIELQRATTTQPPLTGESCEDCFAPLTADQVSDFEDRIPLIVNEEINTIEELCEFLANPDIDLVDITASIRSTLVSDVSPPVSFSTANTIQQCLLNIFS